MSETVLVIGAEPGSGSTLGPVVLRWPERMIVCCTPRAAGVFRELGVEPEHCHDPADRDEAAGVVQQMLERYRPDVVVSTLLGPEERSLDRAAVRCCRERGVRHVAVLDSWSHILSRFDRTSDGGFVLPTVIAVPDALTKAQLCAAGISEQRIVFTGHPFFDEITPRSELVRNRPRRICFLLQPLRGLAAEGHPESAVYTEYDATELFFQALSGISDPDGIDIILKEHPRRSSCYRIPTDMPHKVSVIRDEAGGWQVVQSADLVVGMSSTLLVYAFLANIPVVVTQPGLSANEDPNILTRYGMVVNASTVECLRRELRDALNRPGYQQDSAALAARAAFPLDRSNCGRLLQCIKEQVHG